MYCLKCGKETERGQVFCPECQDGMRQYPVDPNTPIHLHQRNPEQDKKVAYEKEQSEAEIIMQMRRMIRWLTVTIGILSLLLCLLAGLLFTKLGSTTQNLDIGKNYSTIGVEDNT